MDIQLIQEMSAGMERETQELTATLGSLVSTMSAVHWSGHDADRFRGEWEVQQRQITQMISDLRQVAKEARDHAERQNDASRTP